MKESLYLFHSSADAVHVPSNGDFISLDRLARLWLLISGRFVQVLRPFILIETSLFTAESCLDATPSIHRATTATECDDFPFLRTIQSEPSRR